MPSSVAPLVIITCMKRRLSGVTTTITNLLPVQAKMLPLGYVGTRIPGVSEAQAASTEFQHLGFWRAICLSMRASREKPMIWHLRRDHEMIFLIALRALLRLPVRLVFTHAATRRHGWFPLWLISKMDAVIATTPMALQQIADVVPPLHRVIPHGVNTAQFCPPESKALAWAQSGLSGKYGIGVFGRVRPQKGIHLYVQAMIELLPKFPEFTAVICGECTIDNTAYKADLVKKIEAAGLSKRIVFLGLVSNEELLDWYKRVSITVACPLNEGFGLTPLEGMACASAVVASRTGAFEELVIEGETGHLTPTDDAPALIAALAGLMGDLSKIDDFSKAGRERVVKNYSIEAEASKIGQLYRDLHSASA